MFIYVNTLNNNFTYIIFSLAVHQILFQPRCRNTCKYKFNDFNIYEKISSFSNTLIFLAFHSKRLF